MLEACDATTFEPKRMLTYAQIDPQIEGYGICAHLPKDRRRDLTFSNLISPDQIPSIFSLNIWASPLSVLWIRCCLANPEIPIRYNDR